MERTLCLADGSAAHVQRLTDPEGDDHEAARVRGEREDNHAHDAGADANEEHFEYPDLAGLVAGEALGVHEADAL